jgi:hypothetical protein
MYLTPQTNDLIYDIIKKLLMPISFLLAMISVIFKSITFLILALILQISYLPLQYF